MFQVNVNDMCERRICELASFGYFMFVKSFVIVFFYKIEYMMAGGVGLNQYFRFVTVGAPCSSRNLLKHVERALSGLEVRNVD